MSTPEIILTHSGKQHAYHLAKVLFELGYLKFFYTSTYFRNKQLQDFIVKRNVSFLQKRFLPGLSGSKIRPDFSLEIPELLARKVFHNQQLANKYTYARDRKFDAKLAHKIRKQDFDIYWGYLGSCLESLKAANTRDKISICNMTNSYFPFAKEIIADELQNHPLWSDTLDFSFLNTTVEKRLIEEPQQARTVIANSDYLKRTLTGHGISESKIVTVPLGVNSKNILYKEEFVDFTNRPLRVLYTGKVSIMKGIPYLLEAFDRFSKKDVELHIIGDIWGSGAEFKKEIDKIHYQPGVNQLEMFARYCQYDVFIFPSLMESFGNVVIEALSAGLPVIATQNSIAENIITKDNGVLIPIKSSKALADAIRYFRNMSADRFNEMRKNARGTAQQLTWGHYSNNVNNLILSLT